MIHEMQYIRSSARVRPSLVSFIKGRYTDTYRLKEGVSKSIQDYFFMSQVIKDYIHYSIPDLV